MSEQGIRAVGRASENDEPQDRGDGHLRAVRAGDRPRRHAGTSETELQIFDAAERLLADASLRELSVAQIIAEAGVSRATFYFYFASKFAVAAGLLARIMDDIYQAVQPFMARGPGDAPADALRHSLQDAIELWGSHRATMRAVEEHWSTVPELGEQWLGVVERFTEAVAEQIDHDRSTGLAPAGADSRQLTAALLWGTARCLYVGGLGADADLPGERAILDTLVWMWAGAIYGDQHAARTPRAGAAG